MTKQVFKEIYVFVMLGSLIGLLVAKIGNVERTRQKTLTPAQQAEEKKKEEVAYHANIHDYELVSIFPYVNTQTNQFGGITDQEIEYNVIYVSSDGTTHTDGEFTGNISIGDSDIYRVNDNVDRYDRSHTSVVLTRDTASELKLKQ